MLLRTSGHGDIGGLNMDGGEATTRDESDENHEHPMPMPCQNAYERSQGYRKCYRTVLQATVVFGR